MTREGGGQEQGCASCLRSLAHCHGTLVLHADGVVDCDEAPRCGADASWHQWWVTCTELQPACGCTGDEQPLVQLLGQAA